MRLLGEWDGPNTKGNLGEHTHTQKRSIHKGRNERRKQRLQGPEPLFFMKKRRVWLFSDAIDSGDGTALGP